MSRISVLVVDGDQDILQYYSAALLARGLDVTCVEDGYHALRALEEARPEIVVTELAMPFMNGNELQDKILSRGLEDLPILFCATAGTRDQLIGLRPGVDDLILKPVEPDVLNARVRDLVGRSRRDRALVEASQRWTAEHRLEGRLQDIALPPVLQVLSDLEIEGTRIQVESAGMIGSISVAGDRVVHAAIGALVGRRALDYMALDPSGQFVVEPATFEGESNLDDPLELVILEEQTLLRRRDRLVRGYIEPVFGFSGDPGNLEQESARAIGKQLSTIRKSLPELLLGLEAPGREVVGTLEVLFAEGRVAIGELTDTPLEFPAVGTELPAAPAPAPEAVISPPVKPARRNAKAEPPPKSGAGWLLALVAVGLLGAGAWFGRAWWQPLLEGSGAGPAAPAATPKPGPEPTGGAYLLEERFADLANADLDTLIMLRNEILARQGHSFGSEKLAAHFSAQDWYKEVPGVVVLPSDLSDPESQVLSLIVGREAELKARADLDANPDAGDDVDSAEEPAVPAVEGVADSAPAAGPPSSGSYLTASRFRHLEGVEKSDLRMLRNEIYARHGHSFSGERLRSHFGSTDWYEEVPGRVVKESDLSAEELAMMKRIRSLEE